MSHSTDDSEAAARHAAAFTLLTNRSARRVGEPAFVTLVRSMRECSERADRMLWRGQLEHAQIWARASNLLNERAARAARWNGTKELAR